MKLQVKVFFLFVFFVMVSCGQPPFKIVNIQGQTTDSDLLSFSETVKSRLREFGVGEALLSRTQYVTIQFQDDSYFIDELKKSEAVCTRIAKYNRKNNEVYLKRVISIKKSVWERGITTEYKLEMIAHELGHCIWMLDHVPGENEIMSEHHSSRMNSGAWENFARQIIENEDSFTNLKTFYKKTH